jgi:O-antigen/teichoic acid export membrane protein
VAAETQRDDVLDTGRAGGMAIRGGALRTAGYVLAMLMSLASVPFMTRHLGPVDYGYFVTATSIVFILGNFTEAGLTYLGTRRYALLDEDERVAFLRNLVGLRLVLTVLGIVLAVAAAAALGEPEIVIEGTAILGLGLLLTLTQQTYMVSLSARLRLGWVAALELIKQATISAAIILLVLADASLRPFFFASVTGGIVVLACTLAVVRRDAGVRPAFDARRWREILVEVLPFALAAAVGLVYFRLALVLLSVVGTEEETGLYGAAFRIVETVAVIPSLMVTSGLPILARAARDDTARLRYALQRLFDVSVLVGPLTALALIFGARVAIEIVGGSEFEGSVGVLRLQALSVMTAFLVVTWSFALLSLARFRSLLAANLVAAVASALLTVSLVPSMGASGAALATFGAEAILAAVYLVALTRVDRALVPHLGTAARVLPAAAAMTLVGLLLPGGDIVVVAVGSIAYLTVAALTGAIPEELLNAALRRDPAR